MIKYKDLELKTSQEKYKMMWKGNEINFLKYLPIEDKNDLIAITLQKSYENGIYNPVKIDEFFHLHLIYMYSDIVFSEEDKQNENELYNCLKSSGLMDEFLHNFSKIEYNELFDLLNDTKNELVNYRQSTSALIQSLINDLPKQAEAMQNIIDNFDKDKYQNVINFAKAANGNREIE